MTYSDYFENKIAAKLNNLISVVVCSASNTILEAFTVWPTEVEQALAKYNHYKAELSSSSVTIYVND